MNIDEVVVSGQKFKIVSEKTSEDTKIVWKYKVDIHGVEYHLDASVDSEVIEALSDVPSINVEKELRNILEREIRMEIFRKLNLEFYNLITEFNNILRD